MTRKQAIDLFTKLHIKMNYNSRNQSDYASGLCSVYTRAQRFLSGIPFPDEVHSSRIQGEPCADIIFHLRDDESLTREYIYAYLRDYMPKIRPSDFGAVSSQLSYYMGRLAGIRAAIKILGRIEHEDLQPSASLHDQKKYVCFNCGGALTNTGTDLKPLWWHTNFAQSYTCIEQWKAEHGDMPYSLTAVSLEE